MIMAAGFFQADPHPGNLMRPAPRRARPSVLDFGLCKELPDGFGMGLFELMFSMMTMNEAAMIRAFQELGFVTKTGDTETFVELAKRMLRRSGSGRFEGELTEEMTDEFFEAIRERPRRVGAERFRAGRPRVLAPLGDRAHARPPRQRARGDGRGRAGLGGA